MWISLPNNRHPSRAKIEGETIGEKLKIKIKTKKNEKSAPVLEIGLSGNFFSGMRDPMRFSFHTNPRLTRV